MYEGFSDVNQGYSYHEKRRGMASSDVETTGYTVTSVVARDYFDELLRTMGIPREEAAEARTAPPAPGRCGSL